MARQYSGFSFYRLPEEERVELIGKCFTIDDGPPSLYWPIGLAENEFNYGVQQGLIFVTDILPCIGKDRGKLWFRVGVDSPDDLDMHLDFQHDQVHLRQKVIDLLQEMPKTGLRYREVLKFIQEWIGAGTMTS